MHKIRICRILLHHVVLGKVGELRIVCIYFTLRGVVMYYIP